MAGNQWRNSGKRGSGRIRLSRSVVMPPTLPCATSIDKMDTGLIVPAVVGEDHHVSRITGSE